jgi:hypothetical protein
VFAPAGIVRRRGKMISIALLVVLIVVVAAIIAGFVAWMFWLSNPTRILRDFEKEKEALLKNATSGEAKIIEVGSSFSNRGTTDVALRLEVTPQFGDSFNTITVWSIEPAHLSDMKAGKSVSIKIVEYQADKSKTKKIKSIFPAVAWAELYGWNQEFTEKDMKEVDS